MKKSIIVLITLALIAAMLFSCSSTQQESSLAESGEQESTASESSAPAENVPDTFTQGDHVFTRIHKNLYRVKKDRDLQPEIFWLWEAGTDIPKEFPDDEAYYGECELDDNHSLYYRPATLKNDTNLVFHNHETGGLNYAFARACDLLQGGAVQCYFESNKGILEIFGDFYDYDGNFLGSYGLSSQTANSYRSSRKAILCPLINAPSSLRVITIKRKASISTGYTISSASLLQAERAMK